MKLSDLVYYVPLGIALLFVGSLLYGTYRRTEEFTNMKGNYPAAEDIKKSVRAIMDQYYTYDISEFNKIKDLDEIANAGGWSRDVISGIGKGIPELAFSIAGSVWATRNNDNRTASEKAFYDSFKPFANKMYVYENSSHIDNFIESLHVYRKWLTDKIKQYKNDGKPNIEAGRHAPIDEMLAISLKLDAISIYIKNCLTQGYIKAAMEKTKPTEKA
jgi:sarcosine oxidase delta subunit